MLPAGFRYHYGPLVDVEDIAAGLVPGVRLSSKLTAESGVRGAPIILGGLEMVRDVNGDRIYDLGAGAGVVDFNGAVTSWGSAMFIEALGTGILLFAILGIVDTRSPQMLAGLVIGLVVVAIIITVGPVTNASINPARAFGPLFVSDVHGSVHNWGESLCAYLPANLIGTALAALTYDWIAKPRLVQRPVREAVTEPDRAEALEPAATS